MRKLIMLAVLAMVASGCGLASSQINETCLVYSGGLWEDKEFVSVLEPGATNNMIGPGDSVYCYPNDQRSWVSDQDAPQVTVVSQDEVRLVVPYQLYFKVNTVPDVLREFHEDIGVKTRAWTPEGWDSMLNTYFAPQVDRAMDEVALRYPWRELRSSEETRTEFQRAVVQSLKTKINDVIGGNYFCGPEYNGTDTNCGDFTFTVGKPEPQDEALSKSIEREQLNTQAVRNQQVENQRIEAELDARRLEVELYGPEVYACIEQAKIAAENDQQPPPCFFGDTAEAVVDVGN